MKFLLIQACVLVSILSTCITAHTQPASSNEVIKHEIDLKAKDVESDVITWRRHFHEFPELSNREFETAKYIADYLKSLGLEVHTGIAKTAVVAVLRGGKPGPVIGLRADMDALPVKERGNLPFKSQAKGEYLGEEVDVMHACGHDSHMAILMGTAKVLSEIRENVEGTVVFLFQPAEEGAPPGEEGGAELMVKEGVLNDFNVDVVMGLHINAKQPVGTIKYKPGGFYAAADLFTIKVKGKQTHGSKPWQGVHPITVSAQIILGLQTIISRQTNISQEPAVISVGKICGGVRNNIIPEEVEMVGTIRTLDTEMQALIHQKIITTATNIAASAGAEAEVTIKTQVPVTVNDPELLRKCIPTLYEVAGEDHVILQRSTMGAEDFSFFANQVPGLYFRLGGMPDGVTAEEAAPHHTPDFYIDESGFILGVRAFCYLVIDYPSSK